MHKVHILSMKDSRRQIQNHFKGIRVNVSSNFAFREQRRSGKDELYEYETWSNCRD